ncbi:MAG: DegT/DnrJ/EryC1/StrS family aminotransferase [Candidatus Bathyarchaeia archaeon]
MVEKLAVEGGEPVRREPWPRRVQFGEEELNAVIEVMKSGMEDSVKLWRMGGTKTKEFETEFAKFYGSKYAAASSTGTAAIHLAVAACRFEPGSEVITSPITDVGTVTPILIQNLVPIFADVDPETLNVTPEAVAKCISAKTKAIIVVHLSGLLCDMDPILELAEEHNLMVIEDCAQAHYAEYKGRFAGTIGDMGCFSLMVGKHMTSGGEGGMTITDNEELWRNSMLFARNMPTPWTRIRYDIPFPVLNYRMTELQAAIGLVQLKKLPKIVEQRRRLGTKLAESISHLETVKPAKVLKGTKPSYWFSIIHVDTDAIRVSIDDFAEALRREGIPVGARYTGAPMYEYEFLKDRKIYANSCPNAKKALGGVLTLSLHEYCTEREVEDTVKALEKAEANYRRTP